MLDLSFSSFVSPLESFNIQQVPSYLEERSDLEADDATPDAQLLAIPDEELDAILDEQLAQTVWDDKQWDVPAAVPSIAGPLPLLLFPEFDLRATDLTAQELIPQQEADDEVKLERMRQKALWDFFVDSLPSPQTTSMLFRYSFVGDYPEQERDVRLVIKSLSALAKVEALALVGARLFVEHAVRNKMATRSQPGKRDCPVSWPKFRLPYSPEDDAPALTDSYGRRLVLPQYYANSPDDEFVEELQLRMNLVKCPAVEKASQDDIRQAALRYMHTLIKIYRSSENREDIPRSWSHRYDRSAAFRASTLSSVGL